MATERLTTQDCDWTSITDASITLFTADERGEKDMMNVLLPHLISATVVISSMQACVFFIVYDND